MKEPLCPVTGLPSGRSLVHGLEGLVQRGGDGWALFMQLDRIESINEQYGRAQGDETLARVAQLLSGEIKEPLYRAAGPVFVATMSGNTAYALTLAEAVRRAVAESNEFLEQLTLSIGIVGVDEVPNAEALENRGKARMRVAGRRGGNQVSGASPAGHEGEYSGGTVLLVDPSIRWGGVLIREIEATGLAVIPATDGIEALQLVTQFMPEVVISEVAVPKIGGFELRTRLRAQEELAGIPFVLVAHRKNDDLVREAASLDILHYFRKPVSAFELAMLVRNLARNRIRETAPGCL